MKSPARRKFMQLMGTGAVAASLPPSIIRALAIPANNRTGTIKDIEHIIILTQENRSFDHYFGTMPGVRGFADPHAVTLPSGKSVWYQPNGADELLPFRPPVDNLGMTFLPDPPHGWNDTHAAWNLGNHDQWVPNKGPVAMTYHTRKDIPYHFALADAFTICDAYHCSLMGPTDPNRYHMWTGWAGNDGQGGGPVITNAEAGYDWHTYPERLQKAGVTWKIYQDIGDGLFASDTVWWGWTGDPYIGNYGDNSLLFFHQYQNAQPGEPLADFAKTGTEIKALNRDPKRLLDIFREDVRNGTLPQVSWIAAPEAYTEHPNFPANYGAWYISQFIEILADNPEVMSKTVLFINYDEEGGFFDHMVPPTPPQFTGQGDSTVDTINEIYPGDAAHPSAPYGLGMRVPLIVISPWTKGGWVNSQVFDHTSLIRFLEARFGDEYPDLIETNITPWRRAVAGDLTSIFNFVNPNIKSAHLPSTEAYLPMDKNKHPDYQVVAPLVQKMPTQEHGLRPARALPYSLHAHGKVNTVDSTFEIGFANIGTATAVFHVRSGSSSVVPRSYTVEPNKNLVGIWNSDDGYYDLSVYGPNGFFRSFKGRTVGGNQANLELSVSYSYDKTKTSLKLGFVNLAAQSAKIRVLNKYTGKSVVKNLKSGESLSGSWVLTRFHGWYDLMITVEGDTSFEYRIAGHVENGNASYSDPIMGGLLYPLMD